MKTYEDMLDQCCKDCEVEEHYNMTNDGLYSDGFIWIKKELTTREKKCILAEEHAHHRLTVGDILDTKDIDKARQEHKARVAAFNDILSIDDVISAVSKGHTELYDLAEYLDVSEQFLKDYLDYNGIVNIYK